MSNDLHPALITEDGDLPSLTLLLLGDLDADQTLNGLTRAISQTRAVMTSWVRQAQRRLIECAANGDQLGQALCRGRVLTGEHVIAHLDESIIEEFGLWDQYEAQAPVPGHGTRACPAQSADQAPDTCQP
jgi:hypothetical protein